MTEKFLLVTLAVWCGYLIWAGQTGCLTGHDIDAKIQQNYTETTNAPPTPTQKDTDND